MATTSFTANTSGTLLSKQKFATMSRTSFGLIAILFFFVFPDKAQTQTQPNCLPITQIAANAVDPQEQYGIYLINRARVNLAGYMQEQGLRKEYALVPLDPANYPAKQPLAINLNLLSSARWHATELRDRLTKDAHMSCSGKKPNDYVREFGYALPNPPFLKEQNQVESTSWQDINTGASINKLLLDFNDQIPGHRLDLLGATPWGGIDDKEVGVGWSYKKPETSWHTSACVVHSGWSNSSDRFLTGVVYDDKNGNKIYDLNEGLAGVKITAANQTVTTNNAGGWSLKVADGTYTVSASSSVPNITAQAIATVQGKNVEVDFISGKAQGIVNFEGTWPDIKTWPDINWYSSTAKFTTDGLALPIGKNASDMDFLFLVPSKSFEMGGNNYENQRPQHTVKLTQPFYIAKSRVTFTQFYEIMGYYPGGYHQNSNEPVFFLDRSEARLFCARLSLKTGVQCRLPTEAEWEYVARNHADLGLTQGGRDEFVEDDYHPNYEGAPADGSAWYGAYRMALNRGGDVSTRKQQDPSFKSWLLSFRIVVLPAPISVSLQSATNPDHYIGTQEAVPESDSYYCKFTKVSTNADSISATFWLTKTIDLNAPFACGFLKSSSPNNVSFICNYYQNHIVLTPWDQIPDLNEASFNMVPALNKLPGYFSLESIPHPGSYVRVRQSDATLILQANDNTASFPNEASFKIVSGLARE